MTTKKNGYGVVALICAATLVSAFLLVLAEGIYKPQGFVLHASITALGLVVAIWLLSSWQRTIAKHGLLQKARNFFCHAETKTEKAILVFVMGFLSLAILAVALAPIFLVAKHELVALAMGAVLLTMIVWFGTMATAIPLVVTAETARQAIRDGKWRASSLAAIALAWLFYLSYPYGMAFVLS